MSGITKIIKRDGTVVDFDETKIADAIWKAAQTVGGKDRDLSYKLAKEVVKILENQLKPGETPTVEQVQDIVEQVLVENGHYKTAKAYITYRKQKEEIRKEKIALLGKFYEEKIAKKFSINAIRLMESRYLLRDEDGNLIEGPKEMFQRIAALVVIPDILYDEKVFDKNGEQNIHEIEEFNEEEWEGKIGLGEGKEFGFKWNRWHLERMKALYDELNMRGQMKVSWSEFFEMLKNGEFEDYYQNFLDYFNLMVEKKFLPNSPTIFNAGAKLGQLSACFVLDIEDNMDSIMETAKQAAIIFKSGGGIGINYSKLRPEGDRVSSTGGTASGPVSFMRIIDTITDVVKQGGKRRGANMGILEVWHPDIMKFIHAKDEEGKFENFNISVLLDKEFWDAWKNGSKYPLINPKDGKIKGYIDPKKFLEEVAYLAWKTGDPGVLFKDNINSRNVMKEAKGEIRSTNPCGEEPLYPYESCNLGSINLYAFIKKKNGNNGNGNYEIYFDWDELIEVIKLSYKFLDNVIDVNKFPIPEIEKETKLRRKIGLGIMGLADTMFALEIPYNSEEGFDFMRKSFEYITYYSMLESVERAKERGTFDEYEESGYPKGQMPVEGYYHKDVWTLDWEKLKNEIIKHGIRNVEVTTIAPTGSISMFFDVSSGIEPQYALAFEKRVTVGTFYYTDIEFERQLKERGLYNNDILKKVSDNGGSVQGIEEIPEDMRKVFVTALDIPWWDHVRAQGVMQLWVTTSISKTINMPQWVDSNDVLKAYIAAYEMGCKGITIYRDGSKASQVYVAQGDVSHKRIEETIKLVPNNTPKIMEEMGIKLPDWYYEILEHGEIKNKKKTETEEGKEETCPICGSKNLVYQSGCVTCLDCGWSKCVIA